MEDILVFNKQPNPRLAVQSVLGKVTLLCKGSGSYLRDSSKSALDPQMPAIARSAIHSFYL